MTTDLTPEELAGLRERAVKAQAAVDAFDEDAMFNTMADLVEAMPPKAVLRLLAMAERGRALPYDGFELAADIEGDLEAERERAARYREALARIERGWDTNAGNATYRHGYYTAIGIAQDIAHAALAEPKEAQQDRGLLFGARSIAEENMRLAEWEAAGRPRTEPEEAQHGD